MLFLACLHAWTTEAMCGPHFAPMSSSVMTKFGSENLRCWSWHTSNNALPHLVHMHGVGSAIWWGLLRSSTQKINLIRWLKSWNLCRVNGQVNSVEQIVIIASIWFCSGDILGGICRILRSHLCASPSHVPMLHWLIIHMLCYPSVTLDFPLNQSHSLLDKNMCWEYQLQFLQNSEGKMNQVEELEHIYYGRLRWWKWAFCFYIIVAQYLSCT